MATRIHHGSPWLTTNAFVRTESGPTNTSARWTQWIEWFNTFLIASNIKDPSRKRALLLHQVGPEVHEIFKTLPDTGDEKDFDKALQVLTKHFEMEKNRIYQTSQQENEKPLMNIIHVETTLKALRIRGR